VAQGGTLKFVVEVAQDQATGALAALSTAMDQAGIKMRATFANAGEGAKKAAVEHTGLESKLRSLKSEMVSGDRTINFFARSLNGLIPEASAAGQGIRLLADGLIGGVGLGFGIQAVTAGIGLFTERLAENARAEEEAAAAAKKHADAIQGILDKAGEYAISQQAAGLSSGAVGYIMDRRRRQQELNDLLVRQVDIEEEIRVAAVDATDVLGRAVAAKQKERDEINASIQAKRNEIAVAESGYAGTIASVDATVAATKAADKAAEESATAAADRAKRAAAAAVAALREKDAAMRGAFVYQKQLHDAELEGERRRLDELYAEEDKREADEKKRAEDFAEWKRQFNAEVTDWERQDAKKHGEEIGREYVQPMVRTFSQGLGQMMQGQMTFRDFMRNLWGQIVQMVVTKLGEMLTASITTKIAEANTAVAANAAEAASGAAASQASIPIAGPALAMGAMAAMLASVLALKGTYGSAAMGADLPMGGPFPMVLHKREMVLPEEHADTIRNLKALGGAGGSGLTINASFVDASSFRDWLRRGGMDEIQREFDRRVRDGRA
jgi:hypothetical protein